MKFKTMWVLTICICFLGSVFSTAITIDNGEHNVITSNSNAKWTIMVYLDGDNNLEYFAIADFLEMSSVGSTEEVNIVVQFDRIGGYDNSYGDWTTTKRYYITQDMTPTSQNAVMDIGEANTGNPQTLIDFAIWSMSKFPADKFCLILWDHGAGWSKSVDGLRKDVCNDETNYDSIQLSELKNALKTITSDGNYKLELLGFDACLMGQIEVAYEVKNYCKYMTASEDSEPGNGWAYEGPLSNLVSTPNSITGEQLGALFVSYYTGYQITLSTIDINNLNSLNNAISNLALNLISNEYRMTVQSVFENVKKYFESCDIYNFAELIYDSAYDYNIKNYAEDVMTEIENTVTSEKHDEYNENSHGLCIYLPDYYYDSSYDYISFSQNSYWDDLLIYIFEGGDTSNPPKVPVISGDSKGNIKNTYTYTFESSDPDGDDIYYIIDWGDETQQERIGPKKSGTKIEASYIWYEEGGYVIKAKASDTNGATSDWGYYNIMMPKTKTTKIDFKSIIKSIFSKITIKNNLFI